MLLGIKHSAWLPHQRVVTWCFQLLQTASKDHKVLFISDIQVALFVIVLISGKVKPHEHFIEVWTVWRRAYQFVIFIWQISVCSQSTRLRHRKVGFSSCTAPWIALHLGKASPTSLQWSSCWPGLSRLDIACFCTLLNAATYPLSIGPVFFLERLHCCAHWNLRRDPCSISTDVVSPYRNWHWFLKGTYM